MILKRTLLLLVLALVHLPGAAHAGDWDTERCGTSYPFWWRLDGPRGDIAVRDWEITPVGNIFRISFSLVNVGPATLKGGMAYTISHAAVDPKGYRNPAAQEPPASASSLLGTEALVQGVLPVLRPGEDVLVEASARAFTQDASHILTVILHDGGQISFGPEPLPWYVLRLLSPRATPGVLAADGVTVSPVSSPRVGYRADRVQVSIRNVGRSALEAGTPISLIHGPSGSAGGYWGPDDVVDPNDPGNPYASFFREVLLRTWLERPLSPGESVVLEGVAYVPEGLTALQQLTVIAGE